MRSRLAHYIIIAVLVVIAYIPLSTGYFVFEDQILISNSSYITRLQSLSSYLSQEDDGIVDEQDKGLFHTGYYRPLINVTYFLDFKLWGMKAYGFRITNLLLHLLICFLLYELLIQLTCIRWEAFWVVLLFAVHPINTKREFGLMAVSVFFLYQQLLSEKKNFQREIEGYVPCLIIMIAYFVLKKTVVPTPLSIPDDVLLRIAYIPYLVICNLKLIFLPHDLHSFFVLYLGSLPTPVVILSFFLTIFLSVLIYFQRKDSLLIFSVGAFFITLLPVLNIISKASISLIAMRWLYLPMTFLAFGFARMLMKAKLEADRGKGVK